MDWRRALPRPPWRARRETPLERFDRAADSGLLWGVAAAALGASQTRKGRRAGLRGLLNGALAWIVATLVERITGHDHRAQATAAAFTTGAALEAPLAATPAVAATIATLRKAEAPDLTGAALGAGVAFASKRVWPVPPNDGVGRPELLLPDDVGAHPEGAGLFIAVNTASGDDDDSPADELRAVLPQAKVEEIEIVEGDELRKALDQGAQHASVLGISGGDGSINTAAQVAIEHEKPLAVFPSGTLNHLTGAIGIESSEETVEAVENGEAVGVDVATIDGHVFLNTASFGSYVELVDMRERLEKRIGKWPAVLIALVRVLHRSEPLCVEIDGAECTVWMAFIGNCRYSPSGFAPSWRRSLDDGQIDLRYVDGSAPWARLRLVLAVLTGRLGRSKVYKQTVVSELRLRSRDGSLRLARDGETFEASSDEIVVRKLPDRIAIYCPHENTA